MKHYKTAVIGISLLCGASLPALAQSAKDNCIRLQQVTEQNRSRFNQDWVKQADIVIKSRDEQSCQRFAEQAEGAARQLDQQAANQGEQNTGQSAGSQQAQQTQTQQDNTRSADATGGQIMVTQPQPEVTVQQQAPQVQVTQPQPQVTVNQQQPQILVRQAQPTVRVQMPQPVITIDQPAPEIIVRMPPPQVAVNTPQPEVKVTQAQPTVQVRQPQPKVQVQMEQPEVNVQQNKQAQVSVQREEPKVQLQQSGKADVKLTQQQPQVSYEAAQPKVQVEQGGEPKVQFRQTGEARIKVEQMQGDEQAQQKLASNATQAGEDQPTGSTSPAGLTDQDRQRLGMSKAGEKAGKAAEVQASQLLNKEVVNRQGEKLGTVASIRRQNNRDFVVIDHGGALSLSQAQIMVPAERMAMDKQGRVMLMGLTEQDFAALPSLQPGTGQEVKASQKIRISQAQ